MLSLLFPERCVYCGEIMLKSPVPICKDCAKMLPVIKGERCKYCGGEQSYCFCKIGDFAFVQNISVLKYEGVGASIVKRMKFGKKPPLCNFIAKELANAIKQNYKDIDFDFISFVPMNKLKLIKRRFNQSEVIAQNVGRIIGLPVVNTLKRKFHFKDQKAKTRKERIKSIRGQFLPLSQFKNKTILLIDDVFTTGATLSECSYVLKRAGALHVYTATFAITCKK